MATSTASLRSRFRITKAQGQFNAFTPAAPGTPATASAPEPAGLSDAQVQAAVDALAARKQSPATPDSPPKAHRRHSNQDRATSRSQFEAMRAKVAARANPFAMLFGN